MKFLISLALAASLLSVHAKNYDLILRNGRIADGTGNPSYFGDIGVKNGHIKTIGKIHEKVRKMTSLPANTFQIKGRGELREGNWADIVVFDLTTVTDNADYKDPHHYSTGFKYVFVNGVAVVENDVHTDARPGMALRHVANQ